MNWNNINYKIYLCTLIKLFDGITTHIAINMGFLEGNPFSNYIIINIGTYYYTLVSTLLCLIPLFVLKRIGIILEKKGARYAYETINTIIIVLIIFYLIVVFDNLYLISNYGGN